MYPHESGYYAVRNEYADGGRYRPSLDEYYAAMKQFEREAEEGALSREAALIGGAMGAPIEALKHLSAMGGIRRALAPSLGETRKDRSEMDRALNYAGGYDWGIREGVDPLDAIPTGRAYQLRQYMNQPDRRDDAIWDYLENTAGLRAAARDKELGLDRRGRPMIKEAVEFSRYADGGRTRVPKSGINEETVRSGRGALEMLRAFYGAPSEESVMTVDPEAYGRGELASLVSSAVPGAGLAKGLLGAGLAGVISPTGPLTRLLRGTGRVEDEIGGIGRIFTGRSPDEYFERYKTPTTSAAEAMRQYDVDIDIPEIPDLNAVRFMPRGSSSGHMAVLSNPKELDIALDSFGRGAGVREYLKRFDPSTAMYEIDASGTKIGGSVGQQTYPSILDVMSGQKGLLNIPTELTNINEMRRSLNTAEALMRNPALTGKVVPHDTQLDVLRGLTPSEFMDLQREGQIGALQLSGTLKAANRLAQLRNRREELVRRMPEQAAALEAAENLSFSSSPEDFLAYKRQHGAGLAPYGLGETTLRKMALVDAALGSGSNVATSPLWWNLGK